jgi:hypothetical protein
LRLRVPAALIIVAVFVAPGAFITFVRPITTVAFTFITALISIRAVCITVEERPFRAA